MYSLIQLFASWLLKYGKATEPNWDNLVQLLQNEEDYAWGVVSMLYCW